jgi:NAD dependent epimerase/dehydratase
MDWTGAKVLVTGAGGFIGSHLTERLVGEGASVRAFVRYNSKGTRGFVDDFTPQIKERLEVEAGDLRDPHAVANAVRGADYVFHLGALIAIPYSYLHPREVVETNVLGTLNVLSACLEAKPARIIHTSTSEVYGTAQYVPIDEKHPLCGQSPYSASKIGADQLAESFYRSYDLPVATVRPFNTYGPRQSARAVIPTVITQAIGRDKVHIGAMHPVRDLTFVTDTVEGFVRTAECEGVVGQVMNLGWGRGVSVKELVEKIIAIVGRKVEVMFDATRVRPEKSEVDRLVADNGMARKMLGWEPLVGLDQGLEQTVKWISEHYGMYSPEKYAI